MATRRRTGQALVELAVGMFAFALVVSAVIGFAMYIVTALDMRRTMRADAGCRAMRSIGSSIVTSRDSKDVEIDAMAAEYVFGSEDVSVKEKVSLPPMGCL
jgi:hypothetical protein